MARYHPTHSAREHERVRTLGVRRRARVAATIATVVLLVTVAVVIAVGGVDTAWRTISGDELKEQEADVWSSVEESSTTP